MLVCSLSQFDNDPLGRLLADAGIEVPRKIATS
jgi:hypothetical protein